MSKRPAWLGGKLAQPVLALLAAGGAALACVGQREDADLLRGIRGVPSSEYAPCDPDRRLCAGVTTSIEFHTLDELNPFVEYDIGRSARVSRVEVHNRREEPLRDRAVPLVVFTSGDGEHWHQVARRDEAFDVWTATFPPTDARYLKLMVDRHSILHLDQVRAFE